MIFVLYHKTGHGVANNIIRALWTHSLIQTVAHNSPTKTDDLFMACAGRHDWTLRFDDSDGGASCGPSHPCLPTTSDKPGVRWVFKVSEPALVCPDMATRFGGASSTNPVVRALYVPVRALYVPWTSGRRYCKPPVFTGTRPHIQTGVEVLG